VVGASLPALLRFHAASGLRVALRGPLPAAVVLTAAVGMQDEPGAVILAASLAVMGPGGGLLAAAMVAAAAIGMAGWAQPRLKPGVSGWIRHLPADAGDHRRALWAALVVAQAPLALLLAGLVLVVLSRNALDPARVLGMPLILMAAAQVALPAGPGSLRIATGLLACACGASGSLLALAPGLALLALFDRFAGDPGRGPAQPRLHAGTGAAVPARLAWRALGIDVMGPILAALLALGAGAVMIANNAPGPAGVGRVVRLTTILAVAWSTGVLAASMARAIPVWGWLRSLPGSSAGRVTADAAILAVPALMACVVGARWDPLAALAAAACVPPIALRAAGWMRPDAAGRTPVEWRPAVEGSVLAGVVCLLPWSSAIALAASPALRIWAARRESARKVSA
jgi:hypothetical protein